MSTLVITPEPTPNPKAYKFTANVSLAQGAAQAFYSAAAAAGHPIASQLFALEGVTGVMLLRDFCSVNQDGKRDWNELIPQVTAVLRRCLQRRG